MASLSPPPPRFLKCFDILYVTKSAYKKWIKLCYYLFPQEWLPEADGCPAHSKSHLQLLCCHHVVFHQDGLLRAVRQREHRDLCAGDGQAWVKLSPPHPPPNCITTGLFRILFRQKNERCLPVIFVKKKKEKKKTKKNTLLRGSDFRSVLFVEMNRWSSVSNVSLVVSDLGPAQKGETFWMLSSSLLFSLDSLIVRDTVSCSVAFPLSKALGQSGWWYLSSLC